MSALERGEITSSSSLTVNSAVWVTTCSKTDALQIRDMRDRGMTYQQIAKRYGSGAATVRRYHRLFEKYGLVIFAES